jgi:small-conductance mechanosensitive channel
LEQPLWGNTLGTWLAALAVAVFAYLVLNVLELVLRRRLLAWVQRTETDLDDLVVDLFCRTRHLFLVAVAMYAGSLVLTLPRVEPGIRTIVVVLLLIQAGLWSNGVVNHLVSRRMQAQREKDDAAAVTVVTVLGFVGKATPWTIVLLLAVDNIPGVEVDALIASLGIGSVAVALALQSILGDLFASLSIALDQPFVVGDFITVDEYAGTVEHIGLKSTRVRSLAGDQLVFSNSDLLGSRIRNYGRMERRRVSFMLGVASDTPYGKLKEIPRILQEIVESQPHTRFDRAHFKEHGDFSLNSEVVCHVLPSDCSVYMDTRQAINLGVYERFADEGIELPYPTQAIFVARPGRT